MMIERIAAMIADLAENGITGGGGAVSDCGGRHCCPYFRYRSGEDECGGGLTVEKQQMREKLVELLVTADDYENSVCLGYLCKICPYKGTDCTYKARADHLITHGVTVQECKLGDKIYQTDGVRIYESKIGEITLTAKHTIFVTENIAFDERAIGKSIFLSYAEAEAHLPQPPKGE